jgi:hypothetical protein
LVVQVGLADVGKLAPELLECVLPDPDWSAILDAKIAAGLPLPEWPAAEPAPADRSNPESHLAYWRLRWLQREALQEGRKPSQVARARILQAVQDEPAALTEVLALLPTDGPAVKVVVGLLDRLPTATEDDLGRRREVRAWLFRHGGMFRQEVLEDARHAEWKRYLYGERTDPALDAVRERELAEALKVLEGLADGPDPGCAVLGAKLLLDETPLAPRNLLLIPALSLTPGIRKCLFTAEVYLS